MYEVLQGLSPAHRQRQHAHGLCVDSCSVSGYFPALTIEYPYMMSLHMHAGLHGYDLIAALASTAMQMYTTHSSLDCVQTCTLHIDIIHLYDMRMSVTKR